MEFQLKPIRAESIPHTLEKAQRYRLLNEPRLAESICRDLLLLDSSLQAAQVMLVLALTDNTGRLETERFQEARRVAQGLSDPYERHYYSGIVLERWAKMDVDRDDLGAGRNAYESFRDAMQSYEKAEPLSPPGNEDAVLRWNTCVRLIAHYRLVPPQEGPEEPYLE